MNLAVDAAGRLTRAGLDALGAWLVAAESGHACTPPLVAARIPGGRSNLTYAVTDAAGRRWVLRRPPIAAIEHTAHDVLREHRVMGALAGSGVPVPDMVGGCADLAVLGTPFFLMRFVDGTVLHDQASAEASLPEPARHVAGVELTSALARLHSIAPSAVGLDDLGPESGYVERQLGRWSRQLERRPDERNSDVLIRIGQRLADQVPLQRLPVITHGDFRLGNAIVASDGRLRAVLDWELATLGDPFADLGWLVMYWGDVLPLPLPVPSRAAGFADSGTLVEHYATQTGMPLAELTERLDFYLAFAAWRLAAIFTGVVTRARARNDRSTEAAKTAATSEQLVAMAADAVGGRWFG